MSFDNAFIDRELYEYILSTTLRDEPLLRDLREETARLPEGRMQISPDQGQFMGMLIKLIGASRAIEVGVFTGYSSLCVARALPDDGLLVACDTSVEYTDMARRYWERAGVAAKIDLRIGPATETLDRMIERGESGGLRLCLHRRRQGQLPRLLRPLPQATEERRSPAGRQRPLGRPRGRSGTHRRSHLHAARTHRQGRARSPGRGDAAADRRRGFSLPARTEPPRHRRTGEQRR